MTTHTYPMIPVCKQCAAGKALLGNAAPRSTAYRCYQPSCPERSK